MPYQGPKDNAALGLILYDWSRYYTKDVTTKSHALKLGIEFDQNDAMFFYYKDMYENSRLASTSNYDQEDNSNPKRMA